MEISSLNTSAGEELMRIVEILKANHNGYPWHRATVENVLLRVSEKKFCSKPLSVKQNIWQMMWELINWKKLLIRVLKGEPMDLNYEGVHLRSTVPAEFTPETWKYLCRNLRESHFNLIRHLKLFIARNEQKASDCAHIRTMAYGLMNYEVYCLGQIKILIEIKDTFYTDIPRLRIRKSG